MRRRRSRRRTTATSARAGEQTVAWFAGPGQRREFAYVLAPVPGRRRWIVTFRDVTLSRLRERRLAAIAKAASNVASKRSLVGTLETLAQEVARTDALAGVQILTVNSSGDRLHVMGAAGFGREVNFFDKLMECRALGARLMMLEALENREPLVAPSRYDAIMSDPAWAPLHENMGNPRWDWFVSVPLLIRGEPVGILNAFFAPGQVVGDTELEFLLAMAEQAAMAVDQAALLERERDVARREERQKLARDLHDSVVQQVFSMMMQARSLGVLVARGLPPTPEQVAQVADDLSGSAEAVLADLRGMVVELRPAASTERGLDSALRSLVDTTAARTGVQVSARHRRSRRRTGHARCRPARGRLPHRRGGAAQQRQARRRREDRRPTRGDTARPSTAARRRGHRRRPGAERRDRGRERRWLRVERVRDDRHARARGQVGWRRPGTAATSRRDDGSADPAAADVVARDGGDRHGGPTVTELARSRREQSTLGAGSTSASEENP